MGKNKKKRKRPAPDRRPVKKVTNKYATVKKMPSLKEREEMAKRRAARKKMALRILAAILGVAVLVGIVFGIVMLIINRPINYFKNSLSSYVYISEEDYKNVSVVDTVPNIPELYLENQILQLRAKHKGEAVGTGSSLETVQLSAGDEVELRYIGYLLGENGERRLFDGGCNFYGEVKPFEIGSGLFSVGFELGLLGKNTADYATLERHIEGEVRPGDTIRYTATVIYPNGKSDYQVSNFAELGTEDSHGLYGKDFDEFFIGKTIGEKLTDEDGETALSFTAESEDGTLVYTDITVSVACRVSEGEPLTVKVYFPHDYGSEELNGKEAYFDVYVTRGIEFEAPEYNDEFITEKLKLTEESLSAYEGDTLTEKHKNMLRAEIAEQYETDLREVIENSLWEYYLECAEIKRLPAKEVNSFHESYVEDVYRQYEDQGKAYGYSGVDSYAIAIYDLDEGTDWIAYLKEEAEKAVKMKLIFHYICNKEGISLDEDKMREEGKALEDEYLDEYLADLGCTRDKYDTEEEYREVVEESRAEMLEYYGEDFFEYEVFYTYAMDIILEYVTLV